MLSHPFTSNAFAIALLAASPALPAADGDLDPDFGDGGIARAGITDGYVDYPYRMAVQSDGKIVTCAGQYDGPSSTNFLVARFTADGQPDITFSFDGNTAIDFAGGFDTCQAVLVQPDGKIVVVGTTKLSPSGGSDFAVARLTDDGTLDTTFGNGTGKTTVDFALTADSVDVARSATLQADGRIVIAGSAQTAASGEDFAIARLNTDGSRDTTFNLTGRVTIGFDLPASTSKLDEAYGVDIDAQGRIVLSGNADNGPAGGSDMAVARLLPSGQLDGNFSADGRTTIAFDLGGANGSNADFAYAQAIQPDGRILVAGYADSSPASADDPGNSNPDIAVTRLSPDGSLDTGFGSGGKVVVALDLVANGTDVAFAVAPLADGRILLAGAATDPHILALTVRLEADGSLDPSFGTFGKRTYDFGLSIAGGQLLYAIGRQGSRIVLGGAANVTEDFAIDFFVARLLEDDGIFADGFD